MAIVGIPLVRKQPVAFYNRLSTFQEVVVTTMAIGMCLMFGGYLFLVGFFLVNGLPAFHEATGLLLSSLDMMLDGNITPAQAGAQHGLHRGLVTSPDLGLAVGAVLGLMAALGPAHLLQKVGIVRGNG